MSLFSSVSSRQQPLTSILKSKSELVFNHPILYLTWHWVRDQDLGHSGGLLIPCRDSYSEFTEYISHDKDIFISIPGRLQQREIDGQDLVGLGGKQVAHETVLPVSRVLSDLATLTLRHPLLYVRRHIWPIAALSDQLSCPFDALVAVLLVKLVQGLLPEYCRQDELEALFSPFWAEDLTEKNAIFLHKAVPLVQKD